MEYSEEECNAKAEAAHREWAYDELCEEVDQLRDECFRLRKSEVSMAKENAELMLQVGIWRSELEDARLKITAWKAKADRRADKISELEAEVERLRKRDGVRNPVKGPFNWVDQPNDLHNPLGLMPDGKREKYPSGKMTFEENHGD